MHFICGRFFWVILIFWISFVKYPSNYYHIMICCAKTSSLIDDLSMKVLLLFHRVLSVVLLQLFSFPQISNIIIMCHLGIVYVEVGGLVNQSILLHYYGKLIFLNFYSLSLSIILSLTTIWLHYHQTNELKNEVQNKLQG